MSPDLSTNEAQSADTHATAELFIEEGSAAPEPTGPQVTYFGGPVVERAEVWAIVWTRELAYRHLLPHFYETISEGRYLGWLREYSTPTQRIHRGRFMGSVLDENAPTPAVITDDDIRNEILRVVARHPRIRVTENSVFAVHLPPGTTVSRDNRESCYNFCGYHRAFVSGGMNLRYTVIPDLTTCAGKCGGLSAVEDSLLIASHELIETITDPEFSTTTSMASPRAWCDPLYGEIADICAYQTATIDGYIVQTGWSNRTGSCMPEEVE